MSLRLDAGARLGSLTRNAKIPNGKKRSKIRLSRQKFLRTEREAYISAAIELQNERV